MRISVVMATYNGAAFLREQLDSILAQTLLPDEIIISDDGSTDDTWMIIQDYCSQRPDLFYVYKNEQRLGPHQSFKKAFTHATGEFIAPADQDDIWLPNKIERSYAELLESGKDLCFMQERILFENGSLEDVNRKITPLYQTIYQTYLWGHTCMFRRSVLKVFEVCPYYAWDSTIALWCQCHDSVVAIDEVGSIWRRHAGISTTFFSNHSSLIIENISSRKKMRKALRMLAEGKRSEPIRIVMEQERLLIDACYQELGTSQLKLYSCLMKHLSKQTPFDMIMSGWCSMRIISKNVEGLVLLDKVKRLFWAFRKPFVWWYDLRDQKRVGNTEPGYLNR